MPSATSTVAFLDTRLSKPMTTTGTIRNGVVMTLTEWTESVPYRANGAIRFRQRRRSSTAASCPRCGWTKVGDVLAFVRREALDHSCDRAEARDLRGQGA